jgi:predicted SnoaL-like aldol condensation-catalyzing enzyme
MNILVEYYKEVPELSSIIKIVVTEGEYIALHSHTRRSSVDRGKAHMNIFRVKNGKILEHWDVIQEIPEESANKNTMF